MFSRARIIFLARGLSTVAGACISQDSPREYNTGFNTEQVATSLFSYRTCDGALKLFFSQLRNDVQLSIFVHLFLVNLWDFHDNYTEYHSSYVACFASPATLEQRAYAFLPFNSVNLGADLIHTTSATWHIHAINSQLCGP